MKINPKAVIFEPTSLAKEKLAALAPLGIDINDAIRAITDYETTRSAKSKTQLWYKRKTRGKALEVLAENLGGTLVKIITVDLLED